MNLPSPDVKVAGDFKPQTPPFSIMADTNNEHHRGSGDEPHRIDFPEERGSSNLMTDLLETSVDANPVTLPDAARRRDVLLEAALGRTARPEPNGRRFSVADITQDGESQTSTGPNPPVAEWSATESHTSAFCTTHPLLSDDEAYPGLSFSDNDEEAPLIAAENNRLSNEGSVGVTYVASTNRASKKGKTLKGLRANVFSMIDCTQSDWGNDSSDEDSFGADLMEREVDYDGELTTATSRSVDCLLDFNDEETVAIATLGRTLAEEMRLGRPYPMLFDPRDDHHNDAVTANLLLAATLRGLSDSLSRTSAECEEAEAEFVEAFREAKEYGYIPMEWPGSWSDHPQRIALASVDPLEYELVQEIGDDETIELILESGDESPDIPVPDAETAADNDEPSAAAPRLTRTQRRNRNRRIRAQERRTARELAAMDQPQPEQPAAPAPVAPPAPAAGSRSRSRSRRRGGERRDRSPRGNDRSRGRDQNRQPAPPPPNPGQRFVDVAPEAVAANGLDTEHPMDVGRGDANMELYNLMGGMSAHRVYEGRHAIHAQLSDEFCYKRVYDGAVPWLVKILLALVLFFILGIYDATIIVVDIGLIRHGMNPFFGSGLPVVPIVSVSVLVVFLYLYLVRKRIRWIRSRDVRFPGRADFVPPAYPVREADTRHESVRIGTPRYTPKYRSVAFGDCSLAWYFLNSVCCCYYPSAPQVDPEGNSWVPWFSFGVENPAVISVERIAQLSASRVCVSPLLDDAMVMARNYVRRDLSINVDKVLESLYYNVGACELQLYQLLLFDSGNRRMMAAEALN